MTGKETTIEESTNKGPSPFVQTYFHGTKADLKVGDLIEVGFNSNFGLRKNAKFIWADPVNRQDQNKARINP